jgi:hypothetical protein
MEVGLLWYDDDPRRALEDKVGRAAERYHEKYGHWPNTCYVHPQAVIDQPGQDLRVALSSEKPKGGIRLVSAPNILLHHYWLGKSNGKGRRRPIPGAD